MKALVFEPPTPPYKSAIQFGYNVKSSDVAPNSGYYKGDFNKIEGGPLEEKKSQKKVSRTQKN